jgi:hypothetical protein
MKNGGIYGKIFRIRIQRPKRSGFTTLFNTFALRPKTNWSTSLTNVQSDQYTLNMRENSNIMERKQNT